MARLFVEGQNSSFEELPAVKTLNTHIATMAVDTLVNLYTERRRDVVILYEDNMVPTVYEDRESVESRHLGCRVCSLQHKLRREWSKR